MSRKSSHSAISYGFPTKMYKTTKKNKKIIEKKNNNIFENFISGEFDGHRLLTERSKYTCLNE